MRLLCTKILHTLRHRPLLLSGGEPYVSQPSDKRRNAVLAPLLPLIHRAEKFIFDSGSDQDERTIMAVRETALNMLEAGLFHLPHKVVWVEDPWEDAPDEKRNFYLAVEDDDAIRVYLFTHMNQRLLADTFGIRVNPSMPSTSFHLSPLIISLREPSDQFGFHSGGGTDLMFLKVLAEAMYSFKKFIVTLNTENLQIERGRTPSHGVRPGARFRKYEHRIVRVPLDTSPSSGGLGSSGPGKPRRRHLVRGYVFGKNTRPKEQQRWIKPYWRGDAEIGIVERDHYELRR